MIRKSWCIGLFLCSNAALLMGCDGGNGGPLNCTTPGDSEDTPDTSTDIDVRYYKDVVFAGNGCVHTFRSGPEFYATATFEAGAIVRINSDDDGVDSEGILVGDGGKLILAGTAAAPIDIGPGSTGAFGGITVQSLEPGAIEFRNAVIHDAKRAGLDVSFDDDLGSGGQGLILDNVVFDSSGFAGISLGCELCDQLPVGASFTTFNVEIKNSDWGVNSSELSHLNMMPTLPKFTNVKTNRINEATIVYDRDVLIRDGGIPWQSGSLSVNGPGTLTIAAGTRMELGTVPGVLTDHSGDLIAQAGTGGVILEGTATAPIIWDARLAEGDHSIILRSAKNQMQYIQILNPGPIDIGGNSNVIDHVEVSDCKDPIAFDINIAAEDAFTFANNTITNCTIGIQADPDDIARFGVGNTFTKVDRIEAGGGSPTVNGGTWHKQPLPWTIRDATFMGAVVLDPGVHLLLNNSGTFDVGSAGSITANGTAAEPVFFDALVPNDVNGGFSFFLLSGATVTLDHADVSHGSGSFELQGGATLNVTNSAFHDNVEAINVVRAGTMLNVSNSVFTSNTPDILVTSCNQPGITVASSNAILKVQFGTVCP